MASHAHPYTRQSIPSHTQTRVASSVLSSFHLTHFTQPDARKTKSVAAAAEGAVQHSVQHAK
jgi:hypothetical protein